MLLEIKLFSNSRKESFNNVVNIEENNLFHKRHHLSTNCLIVITFFFSKTSVSGQIGLKLSQNNFNFLDTFNIRFLANSLLSSS